MSVGTSSVTPETYRRRIELRPSPGAVVAEMEDYPHHFIVRIEHEMDVVVAASATSLRTPWDTCPVGANGVRTLIGLSLAQASDLKRWATDRSIQCVHTVDLGVLAARHAGRSRSTSYEVWITPAAALQREATLYRDGGELFNWSLDGDLIVAPARFAGVSLSGNFASWIEQHLDDEEREAAKILRRASQIGRSRAIDLDRFSVAGDVHEPDGSCHSYQPNVAFVAKRVVGSSRATELQEHRPQATSPLR